MGIDSRSEMGEIRWEPKQESFYLCCCASRHHSRATDTTIIFYLALLSLPQSHDARGRNLFQSKLALRDVQMYSLVHIQVWSETEMYFQDVLHDSIRCTTVYSSTAAASLVTVNDHLSCMRRYVETFALEYH